MAKLRIGSLDRPSPDALFTVEAQYNPKELELGKQIGWSENNAIKHRATVQEDREDLEYTGTPARTISIELLFDGYEQDLSIEPKLQILHRLSSPVDETSSIAERRRPHVCMLVWGEGELPKFKCVIESVAVKYTMFGKTGRPLRAVCNVKLKETKLPTISD